MITESTTPEDHHQGFRTVMIATETRDSRSIIVVTSHRSENVALYDEAPEFTTLPGSIDNNHDIGLALLHLAHELLRQPNLSSLPHHNSQACAA